MKLLVGSLVCCYYLVGSLVCCFILLEKKKERKQKKNWPVNYIVLICLVFKIITVKKIM